jgi:hypothetical protein
MSRDQNAGHNHSIYIDSKSFEMLEHFKCLGTTNESRLHSLRN